MLQTFSDVLGVLLPLAFLSLMTVLWLLLVKMVSMVRVSLAVLDLDDGIPLYYVGGVAAVKFVYFEASGLWSVPFLQIFH